MKFLIVDDIPTQGKLISAWLRSLGYDSEVCTNGYAALRLLQQNEYTILITDLAMPEMSGVKLADYVKDKYNLPIIVMTGFDQYITDALKFRFVFFKPQGKREFKELLDAVFLWMEKHKKEEFNQQQLRS